MKETLKMIRAVAPTSSNHLLPLLAPNKMTSDHNTITTDDSNSLTPTTTTATTTANQSKMLEDGVRQIRANESATLPPSVGWVKCVFLFFYLFFAGMSNWAVLAVTHDLVPRNALPDFVFRIVDEKPWASIIGDICVALCIVFLAVLLVVHKHRWVILRRVVFCAGTLYWMRSVTLAVTQLPSSYTNNEEKCRERLSGQFSIFLDRLIEQTIRIGFQSKKAMLCGDLLFSGHTLVMVTCSLSVAYYLPKSIKSLQWISHLSCILGMICMIISRTHYTIDVVIAYWLSSFVFRIYHAFCEVDMCMERRKSILYSWWPCRLVDWLEENQIPGRLENRMMLPFCNNNVSMPNSTSSDTDIRQHHKQVSISSSSSTYPC